MLQITGAATNPAMTVKGAVSMHGDVPEVDFKLGSSDGDLFQICSQDRAWAETVACAGLRGSDSSISALQDRPSIAF